MLIIGLNPLTELYLRAQQGYAQGRLTVAGILASGARLKNRILQQFEVLGAPEDIRLVLREQDHHGVNVTRIVLTEPIERLSQSARKTRMLTSSPEASKSTPDVVPLMNLHHSAHETTALSVTCR